MDIPPTRMRTDAFDTLDRLLGPPSHGDGSRRHDRVDRRLGREFSDPKEGIMSTRMATIAYDFMHWYIACFHTGES